MQHLNDNICSGNGNFGVPSIIGEKHSVDEDESLESLRSSNKKMKGNDFDKLSLSIEKHGESLIAVAKIAAMQQEKDCNQARENSISSLIISLHDAKRNLVIHLLWMKCQAMRVLPMPSSMKLQ